MATGPWEFLEGVIDSLNITPPGTGEYDAGECLDLALAEIERLQKRDSELTLLETDPKTRVQRIDLAIRLVRTARNHLRIAGAKVARKRVAGALKSIEGAKRHAQGMEIREVSNAVRSM